MLKTASASKKPTDFDSIRIQLASPETIRAWSHGEVTKPETINYRSFKPERDGLFCERTFGPVKDWNCHCGKYKGIRYRGVVCDRCGVEVTQAKVRRERLGHIELACAVSHIWYFKSLPSRIGALLDISMRNLERVLYYESYVVLDPKDAPGVERFGLLTEDELFDLMEQGYDPEVDMGAPAVKNLLMHIDIEELSAELRTQVRMETSVQRKQEALKRLKVVEAFRQSENRPEWMILDSIPVIPPDLRPLVPLEGGRFATSDLNDLYRRVINRNNRLKKLIQIKAPEVILRNEKRMLQEAVDALFDNGRRSRAVRGDGNRSLKSLSDLLKGKQGRFRQNLLGKRVDYSGRSVIVVGPELKLHQCGLPKSMALELFKPFVIKKLEEKGLVQTVKSAKKLVERERAEVWDILEEIIKDHCVLLNRAPTLHRLGIQAFQPKLVEGKAIRLHPLVCAAFNADFDGDQMAVHVPLSFEAQIEARLLMLAANNILKPADGEPVVMDNPQDIVLGSYYLTKVNFDERSKQERKFSGAAEALTAFESGNIKLHQPIDVRVDGEIVETTAGRLIFNEVLPKQLGFINRTIDKGDIKRITADVHRLLGNRETADFVDNLKGVGYYHATCAGITISIDDVVVPDAKTELIDDALGEVEKIRDQYVNGIITDGERYNKVIDVWTHATSSVSRAVQQTLESAEGGFNSVYIMKDSGARGSEDQIKQLGGMRGLMNKPQKKLTGAVGEIIETPIIASFKEGLSVLEYFISTHGARKGLADTALKTAEAGYLTRRMVDVAQDMVISEVDCGTTQGLMVGALKDGEEIIQPLSARIVGRVLQEDVRDADEKIAVKAGQLILEDTANVIAQTGVEEVLVRSVLNCESDRGICAMCYGRNMATGELVNNGEAVGVVAAQSIGEPGTQLTLRTFHIGGTSSRIAENTQILARRAGVLKFVNVDTVVSEEIGETVLGRNGEIELLDEQNRVRSRFNVPYGALLKVKDDQTVEEDTVMYEWDPYSNSIVSDRAGKIRFMDITDGTTMREEVEETTGMSTRTIVEQRDRTLNPQIEISSKDRGERSYHIPVGARLLIEDGDDIYPGQVLVKIPRERSKTRDITGGLPRVAELFEARRPKEPAVISEIDGTVAFGGIVRGNRELLVTSVDDEQKKYLVPYGKHLRVHEGDRVVAGERLSEGSVNPHDILKVQGTHAVQEYLVNEIQDVYRLQAVDIDDKHIETIVRQMLQKVKVVDPGDTNFLEGEEVDKIKFNKENEKVLGEGGDPATCQPILLGITRASLRTDSFISAASFQETTRVLTEAAVQGKVDQLRGLKENVIIGRLIPAGTGSDTYSDVAYTDHSPEIDDSEEGVADLNSASDRVTSGVLNQ
ncbi:MAG: DNA-directed RNA polymerase subunit beta' [Candidatus Latescibacterota bacterium]|nr:DNA-directed RNA polymerase subunit beta' [Candidatus Latescibacterota bacterium]